MIQKFNFSYSKEPSLQKLFSILTSKGAVARVVGGAVRDGILGLPIHDIDIAINIPPWQVIDLLNAHHILVIPTGISHGTVTAVIDKIPYQITTLRVDVETFGRKADVVFTDDWTADAARRDFTINALYTDLEGNLLDLFNGLKDLMQHKVCFIGDPYKRIQEDYLRILRFFRFSVRYGNGMFDETGLKACSYFQDKVSILSQERLTEEFFKLLLLPDPSDGLYKMQQTGILNQILPTQINMEEIKIFISIEKYIDQSINLIERLFVLNSNIKDVKNNLMLSKKQLKHFSSLKNFSDEIDEKNWKKMAYNFGTELLKGALFLQFCKIIYKNPSQKKISLKKLQDLMGQIKNWVKPTFPMKGDDIFTLGIQDGKTVGWFLKEVKQWWINNDFSPDHTACLNYAKTLMEDQQSMQLEEGVTSK